MHEDEEFLELVAYVRASNRRKDIIKFLSYDLKTPTEIGDALDIRTNHISNILADLRKKNLVVCATPNVRKGRLYKLTDNGNKVLKYL
ncbi:MAG: transcriptional regulator [Methanobrevibacter sp.]|uniref:transcriptional regulator n=1 Tax=Methanobrevibacter sp. TaxID=66852 RepID=UPI0025CEBB40|nr:transcriptional regulator [Methanobrevibacter sp.]MBR0271037.1 transcriptional regulator [Methanobrevibacter sp.]